MQAAFRQVRLLVLGGDAREMEMVRCLAGKARQIYTVGHVAYTGYPNVITVESLGGYPGALPEVDAVIAPMSPTDSTGRVLAIPDKRAEILIDDGLLGKFATGTPLVLGVAVPVVKEAVERHGLHLIEAAKDDEIAILNSIPTAEGAIQIAMEELPITIHGSRALVVGMGRCGLTLARMLAALGAKVGVVARHGAQLARGVEMGFATGNPDSLADIVKDVHVVFNTVPALLLTGKVLEGMAKDTLIIDIASAPGGVDFSAAKHLGLKAILATGLPGKVAPITAGRILGHCLPKMILSALSKSKPAQS